MLEPWRVDGVVVAARDVSPDRVAEFEARLHDRDVSALPRPRLVARAQRAAAKADPEGAERARTVAPTSTRAHLRGQVVTAAQEHGVDHVVDWTTLRLTRRGAMPVQVMDPFATELPAVDALLAEIREQGTPAAEPPLA